MQDMTHAIYPKLTEGTRVQITNHNSVYYACKGVVMPFSTNYLPTFRIKLDIGKTVPVHAKNLLIL